MEAVPARLARQPGKRDEFLLCLDEKIIPMPSEITVTTHRDLAYQLPYKQLAEGWFTLPKCL